MEDPIIQQSVHQVPQQQPPQVPPLTVKQKTDWNNFIDFVDKEGFKGNALLDAKDKNIGLYLMQKYKSQNPQTTVTYIDVPRVQQELQDYRNNLVGQYKKGLISNSGIKSEDEIMPGLSQVDGWLGSKTSQHKFPVAQATTVVNGKSTTKDFGTDIAAFDARKK